MTGVDELVHRFEPAEQDDRTTLLLLHGTGGDETDLLALGGQLAPGAARLSPRGKVSEQGMNRFFRRHAEGVFDTEDLLARTDELADWVRAACEAYDRPTSGLVVAGFSNGANIAAAVMLRHPGLLRGGVLLAPMLPLEPDPLPDLATTAVLIGAGRADRIAPPEQAEALARLLTEAGASVDVAWHDGGHHPDQAVLARAKEWMGKLRAAIGGNGTAVP